MQTRKSAWVNCKDSMEHLSRQLSSREEQLSVLESFIMNHHITDAGFIPGSPVKQERVWISSVSVGGSIRSTVAPRCTKGWISARARHPILATGKGIVSWAGRHPEFGNMVEIDHGNGLVTAMPTIPSCWWMWAPWSMRARRLP